MKQDFYCTKTGKLIDTLSTEQIINLQAITKNNFDDCLIKHYGKQFLPYFLFTDYESINNLTIHCPTETTSYLLGKVFYTLAQKENHILQEYDFNSIEYNYFYSQDYLSKFYQFANSLNLEQQTTIMNYCNNQMVAYGRISHSKEKINNLLDYDLLCEYFEKLHINIEKTKAIKAIKEEENRLQALRKANLNKKLFEELASNIKPVTAISKKQTAISIELSKLVDDCFNEEVKPQVNKPVKTETTSDLNKQALIKKFSRFKM